MRFCRIRKRCLVIRLHREIDHYQAEEIRKECEIIFMKGCIRDVIFDFSGTTFMDSSGIGLVMGRYRLLHGMGGKILISGATGKVEKILRIGGIEKIASFEEEGKK